MFPGLWNAGRTRRLYLAYANRDDFVVSIISIQRSSLDKRSNL